MFQNFQHNLWRYFVLPWRWSVLFFECIQNHRTLVFQRNGTNQSLYSHNCNTIHQGINRIILYSYFIQESDMTHTVNSQMHELEYVLSMSLICHRFWLYSCPDLNLFHCHFWETLTGGIYLDILHSLQELKKNIRREISRWGLNSFLGSIFRRCKVCLENWGWPFKTSMK